MTDQAMTDSEITRVAISYMGKPAWATVALASTAVGASATLIILAAQSQLPYWLCFLLLSYLAYVTYTPLHEAVHKNICGKNKHLLPLNNFVGYVCASLLGVSFTMHRSAHMAHHRATNVRGEDPDFVTQGSSLTDILTSGTKMVVGEYSDYFSRVFPGASASEKRTVIVELVVFVAWRLGLALAGFWVEVLTFTILTNMAGLTLLGYLFAWIVHQPFDQVDRFKDTGTIILPGAIHTPVTALWLWQNYHSIHHLFPKVPFYNYRQLFNKIATGMVDRGAPIMEIGAAKGTWLSKPAC